MGLSVVVKNHPLCKQMAPAMVCQSQDVRSLKLQVDRMMERLDSISPLLICMNDVQDYIQRMENGAYVQLTRLNGAQDVHETEIVTVTLLRSIVDTMVNSWAGACAADGKPAAVVSTCEEHPKPPLMKVRGEPWRPSACASTRTTLSTDVELPFVYSSNDTGPRMAAPRHFNLHICTDEISPTFAAPTSCKAHQPMDNISPPHTRLASEVPAVPFSFGIPEFSSHIIESPLSHIAPHAPMAAPRHANLHICTDEISPTFAAPKELEIISFCKTHHPMENISPPHTCLPSQVPAVPLLSFGIPEFSSNVAESSPSQIAPHGPSFLNVDSVSRDFLHQTPLASYSQCKPSVNTVEPMGRWHSLTSKRAKSPSRDAMVMLDSIPGKLGDTHAKVGLEIGMPELMTEVRDGPVLGRGHWGSVYRNADGPKLDALRLLCKTGVVTEQDLGLDSTDTNIDHINACILAASEMLR